MKKYRDIYISDKDNTHIIKGNVGFFCKHCYEPIYKYIDYTLKVNSDDIYVQQLYHIKCSRCSYMNIWEGVLDPNITKYIALLNSKGYETYCCCEGHTYEQAIPYILFKDNTLIEVVNNSYDIYRVSNKILDRLHIWKLSESGYYISDNEFIKASRLDCQLYTKYSLKERLDALKEFINILPFHKVLNLV